MKHFCLLVAICLLISGCFVGAGTHGHIARYTLQHSEEEIISIVDQFLLANPTYFDGVDKDFGWVYIKLPHKNQRFGFSIDQSEIVLISAGTLTERMRWNDDMSLFEKSALTDSFKQHFIEKLNLPPKHVDLIGRPFILEINDSASSNPDAHHVIVSDTLLRYALPSEFDSLGLDYFQDLVESFSDFNESGLEINQYYNLFRINHDYSGYISDSIYVTRYYRAIGQTVKPPVIFGTDVWKKFEAQSKANKPGSLKRIREQRMRNGYEETDVYSKFSKERWMIGISKLDTLRRY